MTALATRRDHAVNWVSPVNRLCPLTRGLVGWWLCLPGVTGGKQFIDLCGRNHGVGINNPVWSSTMRQGGSYERRFSGSNYIDCGNRAILNVTTSDYAYGGWAKFSGTSVAFFVNKTTASGAKGYDTLLNNGVGIIAARQYVSSTVQVSSAGGWNDGKWHHIISTRYAGTLYLYIDGLQRGSVAATGDITNTAAKLQFAARNDTAYAGFDCDDILLWPDRGLSASEVFALYQDSLLGHPQMLNRFARPFAYAAPAGFNASRARGSNIYLGAGAA